jgi:O-antigen ligase
MASIVDLKDNTNLDRIHMVYTGIEIFKHYPLTGVGANNIESIYPKYQHPDAEHSNPHLHNNFLQILAERGIFTLIGLTMAFFSILFSLMKKVKHSLGYDKTIALGALFVFVGFLISGMFEYNFGDTEIKFILFYFLSIPFLKLKDSPDDKAKSV